jgi:hypothetical protein
MSKMRAAQITAPAGGLKSLNVILRSRVPNGAAQSPALDERGVSAGKSRRGLRDERRYDPYVGKLAAATTHRPKAKSPTGSASGLAGRAATSLISAT